MTLTNLFGSIVDGGMVEDAVLAHCKIWLPTYLREVERQRGMDAGTIAVPKTYISVDDLNRNQAGHQYPICAVTAAGTTEYDMDSASEYSGWFDAGIAIKFISTSQQSLRRRVNMYNAASRTSVIQHPSLGGFAEGIVPTSEDYMESDGTAPNNANHAYALFDFKVKVSGIADRFAGPSTPPVDPIPDPGSWPQVEHVTTTMDKDGLDG